MRKTFLLLMITVTFSLVTRAAAGEPLLIDGGKSAFSIVVPADANTVEKYAAKELQTYLEKIGGAQLPIVSESDLKGPGIFIGRTAAAAKIVDESELRGLGLEGLKLKTDGGNLYIVGGGPRGTLYGVYALLEDHLGCRWYAPDAEFVPALDRVALPLLDETQKPAFEYREPFFTHAFDGTWAVRNRTNGNTPGITAEQGGKVKYSHFVHTFYSLIPPAKYYDEHPEYFSLVGGERMRDRGQLCLTNPDVLRIATEEVMKWIEGAPDATIFSVSQNDNAGNCQCPKCRALDDAEGTPMGSLLTFVNRIADAVGAKYPDKIIDTLAYTYTEVPPKTIKPRPNVAIRLCHMAPSCDLHPLEKCPVWNGRYMRNLKAWGKLTNRIYVWHYVTNFSHYIAPFPNLNAIGPDIATYHDNGVVGYFGQGSYQSLGGDMAELKAWVIAKMLWDPSRDDGALISEFMHAYYGPASKPIIEYYKALHKHARGRGVHAHLYSMPGTYLTRELLELGERSFIEAERLAAADKTVLDRVRRARLSITYVQLTEPHVLGWTKDEMRRNGAHDQWARFDKFAADLKEFKINNLEEWQNTDKSLEEIKGKIEDYLKD